MGERPYCSTFQSQIYVLFIYNIIISQISHFGCRLAHRSTNSLPFFQSITQSASDNATMRLACSNPLCSLLGRSLLSSFISECQAVIWDAKRQTAFSAPLFTVEQQLMDESVRGQQVLLSLHKEPHWFKSRNGFLLWKSRAGPELLVDFWTE